MQTSRSSRERFGRYQSDGLYLIDRSRMKPEPTPSWIDRPWLGSPWIKDDGDCEEPLFLGMLINEPSEFDHEDNITYEIKSADSEVEFIRCALDYPDSQAEVDACLFPNESALPLVKTRRQGNGHGRVRFFGITLFKCPLRLVKGINDCHNFFK